MSTSRVYAVRVGRIPGIYMNWHDCQEQIQNFPGAKYKKFDNAIDAHDFILTGTSPFRARDPDFRNSSLSPTRNNRVTQAVTQVVPAASPAPVVAVASTSENPSAAIDQEEVIIYCDGACKGNGTRNAVAGVGVWWGKDDPRNLSERCPGVQTNNRAELIALIRVLETTTHITAPLVIKSDSDYSLKCVNLWLTNWRKNNFRKKTGEPVLNQPLIIYLDALLQHRRKLGRQVTLVHVRGHMGEIGNEGADELANRGVLLPAEEDRDWEQAIANLSNPALSQIAFQPPATQPKQTAPVRAVNVSQLAMEDYDSIDMDEYFQDPTPTPTGRRQPSRAPATPPPPSSPPAFTTPVRNFSSQTGNQTSPGQVSVAPTEVDLSEYADCLDDLEVGSDGEFL